MQGFKYPKMRAGEQLIPNIRLQYTDNKESITDQSNDLIITFYSVSFIAIKYLFLLTQNVNKKTM